MRSRHYTLLIFPLTLGSGLRLFEGPAPLTEFTLTVMKISSLIKETQTLLSPGQVKFSPGDRPG